MDPISRRSSTAFGTLAQKMSRAAGSMGEGATSGLMEGLRGVGGVAGHAFAVVGGIRRKHNGKRESVEEWEGGVDCMLEFVLDFIESSVMQTSTPSFSSHPCAQTHCPLTTLPG
jgi:hypothetical protein